MTIQEQAAQISAKHDRARALIAKGNWPAAQAILRSTLGPVLAIVAAAQQ